MVVQHVEQLLRALNLNSPAPCIQQPARAVNSETANLSGSPDVSPSSTTSALLTPTDLSPAKTSFDLKVTPPYEVPSVSSNVSPSSLLFDPGSPLKARDFLSAVNIPQSRLLEPPVSCALPSGGFPFFDQYLENTSPALGTQPLYDSAFPQFVRRSDLPSVSSATWRHQQQLPEWRRVEEKSINDFSISLPAEDSLRTSPSQSAFARQGTAGAHSHEARHFSLIRNISRLILVCLCSFIHAAHQFLVAPSPFLVSALSCFRCTYHQVIGSAGFDFFAAETQSRGPGRAP